MCAIKARKTTNLISIGEFPVHGRSHRRQTRAPLIQRTILGGVDLLRAFEDQQLPDLVNATADLGVEYERHEQCLYVALRNIELLCNERQALCKGLSRRVGW